MDITTRADFSTIRYAQCWEDADVLLRALDLQSHHTCLSIASAGDNTMAMLSQAPQHGIAIDVSAAQLAGVELRIAAYRELEHPELLELIGSRASVRREQLYRRCRKLLSSEARAFWDSQAEAIANGIGGAGKFERYFALFRERVLPLLHSSAHVTELLRDKARIEREMFYEDVWDTWRWRAAFKLFFSRFVMGRLGRDPEFFKFVTGNVAERILSRTKYAATVLNPADNPYAQWILTGQHVSALPFALRPENFEAIRANLDRLELRQQSLEQFLAGQKADTIDRFNLSDVFEYVAPNSYHGLLSELLRVSRPQARLAYWNLLAERQRPAFLSNEIRPLSDVAKNLYNRDKAFFYQAFVVEELNYADFDTTDDGRTRCAERAVEFAAPVATPRATGC
jgi:S-adenosylmethionine-diacylglycerol 3-amino-3-carboxypropyl transferase